MANPQKKILVIGIPGGTHYNEILSGVLIGHFSAKKLGQITYIGQERNLPACFSIAKKTRITLSSFPWETLSEYDVLITLGQTGSYEFTFNDKGIQEFTFPISPDNMTDAQVKKVKEFVRQGKGSVAIHTACLPFNKEFNDLIGGSFITHPPTHAPIQEFSVEVEDREHPITRGLKPFRTVDELFFTDHDVNAIHVLLSASYEGRKSPMAWTKSYGEGRIVYIALGHGLETFLNPSFLSLVENSALWASRSI